MFWWPKVGLIALGTQIHNDNNDISRHGMARHGTRPLCPPPPHRRHGTAQHKTGRHTEIPTPPPYAYCTGVEDNAI